MKVHLLFFSLNPDIRCINLININVWFIDINGFKYVLMYNFDFKHFDHLQMVRDEVTKFPQKQRQMC